MAQQSTPGTRKRHLRKPEVLIGILLISVGLGYLLYEYSPLGWVYYALRSKHFLKRVEALVPQYDQLNDELLQSLPVYPGATPLPQTAGRGGLYEHPWPPGGPAEPRSLRICYSTSDTLNQVRTFYQNELEKNGWKLIRELVGRDGTPFEQTYNKDHACIVFYDSCLHKLGIGGKTVYQVFVYHDMNTLLGFPDIPKIVYWDTIDSCP